MRPEVLLGLAAGDMLGAPMEFMTPARVRAVYGDVVGPVAKSAGAFEAGEFTDDTQMALCILAAYPADDGLVARAADAFREWAAIGPRDIGNLTRAALATGSDGVSAWIASGRTSCGNGALMRAAASVAAGSRGDALLIETAQLGAITHADPRSVACCVVFCAGLEALAGGGVASSYADAWNAAIAAAERFDAAGALAGFGGGGAAARGASYAEEVAVAWSGAVAIAGAAVRAGLAGRSGGNSGFAVTTLQTAVLHGAAPSFADGVLPVVREGDDADTVAAVTGAILGARGLPPPDAWLVDLRCGERWSAWPDAAVGLDAVRRIEHACARAAGFVQPR